MKPNLVLVTGAGFSASANLPVQSAVLRSIMEFQPKVGHVGRKDFTMAKGRLTAFLNAVFFKRGPITDISPDDLWRLEQLTLEDVYTIIDKAVSRKDFLLYHDWRALLDVRRSLDLCVLLYMTYRQGQYEGCHYLDLARLMNSALGDSWTTITLNWDTLWDRALIHTQKEVGLVVDYGCSPPWLGQDMELVEQPTHLLGVKLLKLHGSFNWAVCPRCRSLFVSERELGQLGFIDQFECPKCLPGVPGPLRPRLEPMFLTPTLMKTFENPSLNVIWDSALQVLGRATHIVFVGYSFPLADHDLRYMLRKAVPADADIKVILSVRDRLGEQQANHAQLAGLLPPARYTSFFGLDKDAFVFEGWETYLPEFVESLTSSRAARR